MTSASWSPARASALALWGFFLRDLRVLSQGWTDFLSRTLVQPVLFVFVFTYVIPRIGGQIAVTDSRTTFATIILPGLVAFSATYAAIFAVGIGLSVDFGVTREIDDRVLAPAPTSIVAIEKMLVGAFQGLLAGLAVVVLFVILPVETVQVDVNWGLLVVVVPLACLMGGALGVALGVYVPYDRLASVYSLLPLTLFYFGCNYYTWESLRAIRWLQILVLIDPLVYFSEALRAAVTPDVPHMNPVFSIGGLVGFTIVLLALTFRRFEQRCTSQ